jgi:hypothetical protein
LVLIIPATQIVCNPKSTNNTIFNETQTLFGSTKYISVHKAVTDHAAQKQSLSSNERQSLTELRADSDLCNSKSDEEANPPVTWTHPDSPEPVKRGQKSVNKMHDHEKSQT